MSYRDDIEAAAARAESAERELADARAKGEADAARIEALEKELAAAQRAKAAPPPVAPAPAAAGPPRKRRSPAASFAFLSVTVGIAGYCAYMIFRPGLDYSVDTRRDVVDNIPQVKAFLERKRYPVVNVATVEAAVNSEGAGASITYVFVVAPHNDCVRVSVRSGEIISTVPFGCKLPSSERPRCKASQIVLRAREAGAAAGDLELEWKVGAWDVFEGAGSFRKVAQVIPDDCS
jgi:hypothetical protein